MHNKYLNLKKTHPSNERYVFSKLKVNQLRNSYLRVTLAPTSSSLAWISSASSLATPSLITEGAPSTKPLASFKPRPVISLTALITLTLPAPGSVNSTSNSLFSSAAPAVAPAAATGAAAETPNSSSIAFTKSFNSRMLALLSQQ